MSTKSTIAYGDDFHFYEDCFNTDWLFLKMSEQSCSHTGCKRCITTTTVAIPRHLWMVLREYDPTDVSLADKSLTDLVEMANAQVNKQQSDYKNATGNLAKMKTFYKIWGYHKPRKAQLDPILASLKERRRDQRTLLRKAEALRDKQKQ